MERRGNLISKESSEFRIIFVEHHSCKRDSPLTNNLKDHAERLSSGDVEERLRAAEALCAIGQDASECTIALIDALADPNEGVREQAIAALEAIETPAVSDTSLLAVRLNHPTDDAAYWATTMLGRIGPSAAKATGPLAAVMANEERAASVRQRAAWALSKIGPPAADSVPPLQAAAKSADTRLASLAEKAIAAITNE